MLNARSLILGVCLILPSFAAFGQNGNGSHTTYDIGIFSGFRSGGNFEDAVTGETLDLDEGTSGGVVVRIAQSSRTFVEILYTEQSTRTQAGGLLTGDPLFDMNVRYLHIGGIYELNDALNRPYVMGSVGLTRFEPQGALLESETRFSLGLGAGYLFPCDAQLQSAPRGASHRYRVQQLRRIVLHQWPLPNHARQRCALAGGSVTHVCRSVLNDSRRIAASQPGPRHSVVT